MTMTDGEITRAVETGQLKIDPFSEKCLKPSSYDARIGERLLRAGEVLEIPLEKERSVKIRPGEFFLFTTRERFELEGDISGHLGSRTHFTHRGLILLCGQHIDPGFKGVLILAAYNAAPKPIAIDYESRICNIEFHRLSQRACHLAPEYPEHSLREFPPWIKEHFRGLAATPLYVLSEGVDKLVNELSALSERVSSLEARVQSLNTMVKVVVGLVAGLFVAILAGLTLNMLK